MVDLEIEEVDLKKKQNAEFFLSLIIIIHEGCDHYIL